MNQRRMHCDSEHVATSKRANHWNWTVQTIEIEPSAKARAIEVEHRRRYRFPHHLSAEIDGRSLTLQGLFLQV